VILTGGDPFMLSPRRIADVTQRLGAVSHVKVLRWHTRVPVADPGRVSPELVDAISSSGKTVYVAVHANHARLTDAARAACAGSPTRACALSQTVLLKGINDDAQTHGPHACLLEGRIKPYYRIIRLAPGTGHFRPSIEQGQAIVAELRRLCLSGLAQPTYVLDIPGGHGKVPWPQLRRRGRAVDRRYRRNLHHYPSVGDRYSSPHSSSDGERVRRGQPLRARSKRLPSRPSPR
jgi:lysine 2,3-aminomutase